MDTENKWGQFKQIVNLVIEKIAPLKGFKVKDIDHDPWYDKEIFEAEKLRDYLHHIYSDTYLESDLLKFKSAHDDFQKLRRQKQKDYYESKKIGDFKNNKLFWHCYSKSIKIKSEKTGNDISTSFVDDGRVIDDPAVFGNMFNSFFTNLSSTSNATYEDSEAFIADVFLDI
jgi:hypothetical protein